MVRLNVNGKDIELDAEPDMPLLWALRDLAGILGPKFGCGMAMCGACTVFVNGEPVRSCSRAIGEITGSVITIEGLEKDGRLHPVQQAWMDEQVSQCGYCQAGQIISAVALLNAIPNPDDKQIDEAMGGNLCRCGTYPKIRAAIHRAAESGVA